MLLVIPVTVADQHLAKPLLSLMVKLGGVRPHKILFEFSQTVPGEMRKEIEELGAQCGQTFSRELKTTDERGWPRSANSIFSETALHVFEDRSYGEASWYFFELDNTPMCRDWVQKLQDEYNLAKMPCMGVINRTMRGSGELRKQAGSHLVGTAIYPVDFWTRVKLCRHINSLPDPWDVALQWEVAPISHPTDLIQHSWGTHKYAKKGARIECKPVTDRPGNDEYANPVSPRAVVVHGCKDGSLAKIVEDKL
jgi:hypothetical protein